MTLKQANCIDTDAAGGSWLTCLDVNGEVVHLTNEAGEYRTREMNSLAET